MRFALLLAAIMLTACGPSVDPGSDLSGKGSLYASYPQSPQGELTDIEGTQLCSEAEQSETRYPPQNIPYCGRSVSSSLKKQVIRNYDKTFGYTFGKMPRNDFKIDHFIPLCMGGNNKIKNLWPQHKTVYVHTDDLEQKLCLHLAANHLPQERAVAYIIYAKMHVEEAEAISQEIDETLPSLKH